LCKLCLIVFGALLAVQSVSAGNWNKSKSYGNKIPNHWLFEVDFSTPRQLEQFDMKRFQNCDLKPCGDGFIPAQIVTGANGNEFLEISARHGQLAHLNKGGNSFRNELGTKSHKFNEFDLNGLEFWYGFRVRTPDDIKQKKFRDNTFSQIKQVTKSRKGETKLDCSKGVVFHMNTDGKVYNGYGISYPRIMSVREIVSSDWSTYKVGLKFSYDDQGWIKVFKNSQLVWHDKGPNLISEFFAECRDRKIDLITPHLRIGVYAKSSDPNAVVKLHFDDYVSGLNEDTIDRFHEKTKKVDQ
ncbi:MAG: heparin lyase I family protein, partial [Deltaproteobacteria bacterium]